METHGKCQVLKRSQCINTACRCLQALALLGGCLRLGSSLGNMATILSSSRGKNLHSTCSDSIVTPILTLGLGLKYWILCRFNNRVQFYTILVYCTHYFSVSFKEYYALLWALAASFGLAWAHFWFHCFTWWMIDFFFKFDSDDIVHIERSLPSVQVSWLWEPPSPHSTKIEHILNKRCTQWNHMKAYEIIWNPYPKIPKCQFGQGKKRTVAIHSCLGHTLGFSGVVSGGDAAASASGADLKSPELWIWNRRINQLR